MNDDTAMVPITGKPIPRVSIGMPVYNGEKFIRDALDSLLAQTFTDFELIISDNASTDGTEAICREYAEKDRRIRYVRQVENLGVIANFKFVLDEAVAEYFMWAAADDIWDNNWVAVLLPVSTNGRCLAYGTVQTIDGNGSRIPHPANTRKFNYSGPRLARRLKYYSEPGFLGKANPMYGIYPKRIFNKEIFSTFASNCAGADMLFLYRLLADADIKVGATVLYKRIHDGCAGGGASAEIPYSKKKNIALLISKFLLNNMIFQYRQIIEYGSLSNAFERAIQLLMSPFLLIVNTFYFALNYQKFGGKWGRQYPR